MSNFLSVQEGFRDDLEGLRGIAVLLVVLFHFNLFGLTNGFFGVDLFFVISGFLMTQILLSDRFYWRIESVKNYYSKRFWRIAPAYLIALIIALIVALSNQWALIIDNFTQSLLSALVFSYNLYAPIETGYFAAAAITKPFLHLWSLGVEVQFYLIWPIVLFFLHKRPFLHQIVLVSAISGISLAYSGIAQLEGDEDAYFSLVARLWQFGAGALVALVLRNGIKIASFDTLQYLGLGSLLCVITLSFASPFDSWNVATALLVTIAGATLIFVGGAGDLPSSALMSVRPIRMLGRISYSVYLVHWPLAVGMYFYFSDYDENTILRLGGASLSILLGALLYWAIEQRFRVGRDGHQTQLKKRLSVGAFAILLLFGVGLQFERLWPLVFNARLIEISVLDRDFSKYGDESCNEDPQLPCALGAQSKQPELMLWGDSHARHFALGIDRVFTEQKREAISFATSACPPVGHWLDLSSHNAEDCRVSNQTAMAYLSTSQSPRQVILAARWFAYHPEKEQFSDEQNASASKLDIVGALDQTLSELQELDKQVTIALQAPEYREKGHLRLCQDAFIKDDGSMSVACKSPASTHLLKQMKIDAQILEVASKYNNVRVADVKSVFCDDDGCVLAKSDKFYYRDTNHLNRIGAERVVREAFIGM
ncbi:acyltransferase family protein [Pseudovibrio sp. SCP19]|uniref:acyltransferase family protein n=1 Tax=Pseudovibrio sp. SCP19 TaxID=3141374 RepID=UPI003334CF0F